MAFYRVSDSKGHLVRSDRTPYVWIQILYASPCVWDTACQPVQGADNSDELMSHLLYMKYRDGLKYICINRHASLLFICFETLP